MKTRRINTGLSLGDINCQILMVLMQQLQKRKRKAYGDCITVVADDDTRTYVLAVERDLHYADGKVNPYAAMSAAQILDYMADTIKKAALDDYHEHDSDHAYKFGRYNCTVSTVFSTTDFPAMSKTILIYEVYLVYKVFRDAAGAIRFYQGGM